VFFSSTRWFTDSEGNVEGAGLDLGWSRRDTLLGSDANWRFAVFDRPGSSATNEQRNRGVDITLSLALGSDGRQISGSVGTRTARDGDRRVVITPTVAGRAGTDAAGNLPAIAAQRQAQGDIHPPVALFVRGTGTRTIKYRKAPVGITAQQCVAATPAQVQAGAFDVAFAVGEPPCR